MDCNVIIAVATTMTIRVSQVNNQGKAVTGTCTMLATAKFVLKVSGVSVNVSVCVAVSQGHGVGSESR